MTNLLKVTTAPVVSIGSVRIDGTRLRRWSKGVTVNAVRPLWEPVYDTPDYRNEGPANISAAPSCVIVEGYVASKGLRYSSAKRITTRAMFIAVTRRVAIEENSKWAERERLKLAKSNVISPTLRKAFKALEFDGEQDGLIPVSVKTKDVRVDYRGVPVSVPQFPLLSFAVVRKDERSYSVTELLSGDACGFGNSAEKALLAACERAATLSPEAIGKITAKCFSEVSA